MSDGGRHSGRRRCKHHLLRPAAPGKQVPRHPRGGWALCSLGVSETVLAEIFRHKEKIVAASHLDRDEVVEAYHAILTLLDVRHDRSIPLACAEQAVELCRDVDPDDAAPVALTLAVDGVLWTGDKALKAGLMAKGFERFFEP